MTNVTEHYTEEEGEGNDCEHCGIDLLMHWNTIGIYYLLEGLCKFVSLDIGWRFNRVVLVTLEISSGICSESLTHTILLSGRAPKVANIGSFALFEIVKGRINGFLFGNKPFVNLECANAFLVKCSISLRIVNHVDLLEISLKVTTRGLSEVLALSNIASNLIDLLFDLR